MKNIGYVHIALFTFLSVFVVENSARSHCSVSNEYDMNAIGVHIAPAKQCCQSPFQSKSFVNSCQKAPIATLNAIVINNLLDQRM